jgi:hypothetical protein
MVSGDPEEDDIIRTFTSATIVTSSLLPIASTHESKKAAKNRAKKARKKNKQKVVITFGSIEVLVFTLDLGYDVIPSTGFYPLGLGTCVSRKTYTSIDMFEAETTTKVTKGSNSEVSIPKGKYQPLGEAERMELFFHTGYCTESTRMSTSPHENDLQKHMLADINKDIRLIRDARNSTVTTALSYYMPCGL